MVGKVQNQGTDAGSQVLAQSRLERKLFTSRQKVRTRCGPFKQCGAMNRGAGPTKVYDVCYRRWRVGTALLCLRVCLQRFVRDVRKIC